MVANRLIDYDLEASILFYMIKIVNEKEHNLAQ